MADARETLNIGNVLHFIHGDTEDLSLCDNGIYISDTFTAEIGKEIKAGETLSFQLDNIYMKNGSITNLGVGGDPIVIPDPDAWAYQTMWYIDDDDDCAHSVVLDNTFNNATGHKTLIAGYLTYENNATDYVVRMSFVFYDADTDTIMDSFSNSDNRKILYVDMTSELFIKADVCGRTGGSTNYEFRLYNIIRGAGYGWATLTQVHDIRLWHFQLATSFATNIPLFDSREHAEAYLRDNTVLIGLLNGPSENPEEEYKEKFAYWYVKNTIGKNTRVATSYTQERNYRFFPKSEQKICFLKKTPTASDPYDLELHMDFSYAVKRAHAFDSDDEDYEDYVGSVPTKYLSKSIAFGNDYYTKFIFDTNIPIAGSQQDIDDYFNGIKTIDEIALNWDQIARQDDYLLDPEWQGTSKDSETPTGSNGMTYTYGSKLYEVSNIELSALFNEVFDPDNVQAILDGNKLFSSETLACINSITYFPLTSMDDVCEMGSSANVWIGSWKSQNCQGRRITKNNKKINIGTFQMSPTYNDFRDFEPYTRVYVQLPFAGCHELTVSKYMGKAVKVEASIDITTGTILYLLYGNNILLDQFSGTCGAQRPFTARDSAQYISNVVNAVTGASNTMTSASRGASDIASGMSAASKAGISAGAVTAGGVVAGGALIGVGAVEGVYKAYGIKNAIDNPPLISTGSLAGCAAYAANTKVSFIVAQKKTIVPANLQTILGRPSNQGGTVGSFTGYLKCSAFSMSNFTGTKAELDEIYSIMAQGIYI